MFITAVVTCLRGFAPLWQVAFPPPALQAEVWPPNPLLRDPFCAQLYARLQDARRHRAPVAELETQLAQRVDEILGAKGKTPGVLS